MILSFLTGLASLAWISLQDWINEEFNALIPVASIVLLAFFEVGNIYYPGFFLNLLFFSILVLTGYLRPGDILALGVYIMVFNSFQSFFTLLMVMGLYLYAYPKIAKEKDWIAFVPAILISYIMQGIIYLV